jgi:2'-hydroxyisoflavone reductase
MRLLVLGGTEFAGRAVVEAALGRGWEVTVLNRGRHQPPAGVRALRGDRTAPGGLAALASGEWDAVIDTWSAAPRAVARRGAAAGRPGGPVCVRVELLGVRVGAARGVRGGRAPRRGGRARRRQDRLRARQAGRGACRAGGVRGGAVGVRPGRVDPRAVREHRAVAVVVGAGCSGWAGAGARASGSGASVCRCAGSRGVVARVGGAGVERGVQPDLGAGARDDGVVVGRVCAGYRWGGAELRWTSPEVVLGAGIEPWTQLPVWVPAGSEGYDALHSADVSRALGTGLTCRSVEETVADTWEWLRSVAGVCGAGGGGA